MKSQKITTAVLLPLYNPESFLDEQLESLLSQDFEEFFLVWGISRCDENREQIEEKIRMFSSNKYVEIEGFSATAAFFELLENAIEFEYVAFCDQDDIWDRSKLRIQTESLQKYSNIPALSHSNFKTKDGNTFRSVNNCFNHKVSSLLEGNCARGCTMVLNTKLARLIVKSNYQNVPWHDWWTILVASSFGTIVKNDANLIEYRVHKNNLIGIPNFQKRIKNFLSREVGQSLNMARGLINLAESLSIVPPTDLIKWLSIYGEKSPRKYVRILFSPRSRRNPTADILRRLLFIVKNP